MKIKRLVAVVGAALYGAGTLHAAGLDTPPGGKIEAPKFTAEQLAAWQKGAAQTQTMMANDGLNVSVSPRKNKFIEEDGITGDQVYIVRLTAAPVSVAAQMPSSPLAQALGQRSTTELYAKGKAANAEVARYESLLLEKQSQVVNNIAAVTGRSEVRRQFTKAINGFSMVMTPDEARRVSEMPNVASVARSKLYELLTDEGPDLIEADQIWSGAATPDGAMNKGEGQIVGIVDTGINSDHPSFADVGADGYDHTNPWGEGTYVGDCVEDSDAITCNDKLIGVHSYDIITDVYNEIIPGWPAIGEDYQGHGSHVASTAAGNVLHDVDYMVSGTGDEMDGHVIKEALFPTMSGVAPHANIIAYQVCYPVNDAGYAGCPSEALVAGIEDAIADGVDVINFSIGGADSNVWADPVQMAFLSAREAGINVAAAAGNSGSGSCGQECFGYLDNSSPWLTQVAATTHGREVAVETAVDYAGFIDDTKGSEVPSWAETGLVGGALNDTDITGVVVWAKDYVDESGSKDYNGYCVDPYPAGTFDFFKDGSAIPGAAEGTTNVIVVCQRHDPNDANANARTAKVDNVKAGGADGFIMYNRNADQGTVAEAYSLPGVHFTYAQWNGVYPDDGLEDWVDSYSEVGHMITIHKTVIERRIDQENADWLATFSSRGPSYSNTEILAPAVSAPGVNIYAAYSDEHPFTATPYGADYSSLSGTSMASPHVAGSLALIRQTHPEWTAAEVQSALLMTAEDVVKYHRLNQETGDVGHASTYRAGTGRINVANAVKAGLVMDETAENFMEADPNNGGTPHRLNLPNLVNFSCKPECQWVRTVKATRDGTWTVTAGDVTNWNFDLRSQSVQNGVNIDVYPQTFTLKAGETQSIVVKARVMDTQDVFSNSEVELHGDLTFTADNADIPDSRWPMVFKYDAGELPSSLDVTAHEDTGSYQINSVPLPSVEAPFTRVYEPVKANIREIELPIDDDRTFPWAQNRTTEVAEEDILDEATDVQFIDVPANAKRLIVESLETVDSPYEGTAYVGNPIVYVGYDYNNDGVVQPQDEILCVSNHTLIKNFCNINNPEPGKYWAIVYNTQGQTGRTEGGAETFSVATAVVTDAVSSDMTLTAPSSDGYQTVDLTIDWSMDMEKGDIYYTTLDVGTSEVNAGNIGRIPLKLTRGTDRISLEAEQTHAKTGDRIPLTFAVLPNQSGADRNFTITTTLPDGLDLSVDNVFSSTAAVDVTVDGKTITISGVQADTSDVTPGYKVTTNADDALCKTPDFGQSNPGGYVNLSEFGIGASLGGFDDSGLPQFRNGTLIPVYAMYNGYYDSVHLYNNTEATNSGYLQIRGNGMVDLTGAPYFFPFHDLLKFNGVPFEVLAPLWRARGFGAGASADIMSVDLSSSSGISLASTSTGWGIIEWDNAADYGDFVYDRTTRTYTSNKRDNSFDFELLFNANTRFGDGEYEILFAYDNIDFGSTDNRGSIGIKGFYGPATAYGPLYGYQSEQVAFDDVDTVMQDGMVVCMDYYGPESSQFEVTAWVDVPADTAGQTFTVDATADMDGMEQVVMTHSIEVASNITVGSIRDMETMEDTAVDFTVIYADEVNSANQVSVSAEHVTADVNGDVVTLTPEADFAGETVVTVTVADIENPTDAATTSFTLTVVNEQDAPVVMVANNTVKVTEGGTVTLDASGSYDVDGDTLAFTWTGPGTIDDATAASIQVSGLSVGTHNFTVTVTDGIDSEVAEVTVTVSEQGTAAVTSKSGGSVSWILAMMALTLLFRRNKEQQL